MRSGCCARTANGKATAKPANTLMNSRRRMCRPPPSKSGSKASMQRPVRHATRCPLWVKSRHQRTSRPCPLYLSKRTSIIENSGTLLELRRRQPLMDIANQIEDATLRSYSERIVDREADVGMSHEPLGS